MSYFGYWLTEFILVFAPTDLSTETGDYQIGPDSTQICTQWPRAISAVKYAYD